MRYSIPIHLQPRNSQGQLIEDPSYYLIDDNEDDNVDFDYAPCSIDPS